GYTVVVDYDLYWIQSNNAVEIVDIDSYLFKNITFMNNYNDKNDANLIDLIQVPTAPMGLYSGKYEYLEEIENGSEVALLPDPTIMSRAFMVIDDAGVLKLKDDVDIFVINVDTNID